LAQLGKIGTVGEYREWNFAFSLSMEKARPSEIVITKCDRSWQGMTENLKSLANLNLYSRVLRSRIRELVGCFSKTVFAKKSL
jgi:hypothetical protein